MNGQTKPATPLKPLKTLKTALVMRGHTEPLRDDAIAADGFRFDFADVTNIVQAFRRMVRGLEFDVSEMAMTTYLCARAHGKAFTAIPVFPMRAFHHGAILCNTKHGIPAPRDLEGKKVGVNRGYTVTTGLWARAILQHEYGVDLRKITWVLSGDEHVAEYRPPAHVVPIEPGKTIEGMLSSGELAAAVGVQIESPEIKPLIPNARTVAFESLKRTGLYPINHTVVIRDDVLQREPRLAVELFEAFAEAKRLYIDRLTKAHTGASSPADETFRRVMEITGDPLPYGIEPNRKMLEAIVRYSVEQDIIPKAVPVEELFAAETRILTA